MGAIGCVVHCGKFTKQEPEEGLMNMKKALDFIINEIKRNKWNSKIILETSSGQGTEMCYEIDKLAHFCNKFLKHKIF